MDFTELLILGAFAAAIVAPLVVRGWDALRGRHAQRARKHGEDDLLLGALADGVAPERSVTEDINARGSSVQSAPPTPTPKALRDARMRELERLYVADEISVEEYEAKLDEVMRSDKDVDRPGPATTS